MTDTETGQSAIAIKTARRFTETVNPPAAPTVVVVSDDARVGPALVSYLSASTDSMVIEGPIEWASLGDGVRASVAVCDLDRTDLSAALDRLEAMSRDPSLKVIALSTSAKARRRAVERGAVYAADKSTDMDRLTERIRSSAGARNP